jgi:hypothetical protein
VHVEFSRSSERDPCRLGAAYAGHTRGTVTFR